ncbi:MAG: hypothetical protein U1E65_26695 [Myxococcota bacterium]
MTDHMDVRIRNRYAQKGVVTRAEIERYLTALPDMASNVEYVDYEKRFEEERAQAGEHGRDDKDGT